ncbi:hypothetical protein EWM64_g3588 [Hericium alpestre]|uniref:Uncharacterized protein n=1 Tax=Hericium alpestre TaxID=135208 RepID=A0A4Z0A261_9AGAM|nr:hypothetical protein EWM64_g3588 [Hericium alpestre]
MQSPHHDHPSDDENEVQSETYHSFEADSDTEEIQSEESVRVRALIASSRGDLIGLQNCLRDAEQLKQEGNEFFRSSSWSDAMMAYRRALVRIPARKFSRDKGKGKKRDVSPPEDREELFPRASPEEDTKPLPLTGLDLECAKARAILNANIAACHVKLGEHEEAVKACTKALEDDPSYVKPLQRRAQCNERIGSWTALSAAQEDYKKLVTLLPPSSPQANEVQRALRSLGPRVEAAQKLEMGEMMDKLKGMGNRKFGLSTDNFKFEPNGQGGYSMNFAQ